MKELYSEEVEQALLGAIMLEGDTLNEVINEVPSSDYFYFDKHRYVYDAILRLHKSGVPVDMLTVTSSVKEKSQLNEVGGSYFIASLTTLLNSASNILSYCLILKELFIKRKLNNHYQRELQMMTQDGYDVFRATERYELLNSEINNITLGNTLSHIKEVLIDSKKYIEECQEGIEEGRVVNGVDFGIIELSGVIRAKAGNLIIIAARPSMGKTALLVALANEVSLTSGVGIISLEMTKLEMVNRFISYNTHISTWAMENTILPEPAIQKIDMATSILSSRPIYIDDRPRMNIQQVRARAYYLKQRFDIKILFIDYLGIMDIIGNGYNLNNALGVITRELKILAKELGIPVVLLSQLSRESEKEKRKPSLSDLRDSGAIEQDADMVIFPHRPEKYGIMEYEDGTPTADTAQIIVAKNRGGATCEILVPCKIKYNHFGTPKKNNTIYEKYNIDLNSGEVNSVKF